MYFDQSLQTAANRGSRVTVTTSDRQTFTGVILAYTDRSVSMFDVANEVRRVVSRQQVTKWFFDWSTKS